MDRLLLIIGIQCILVAFLLNNRKEQWRHHIIKNGCTKVSRTAIIVTGCIIVLGIYDLITVSVNGVGTSISRYMQDAGLNAPFVVFAVGFICGHIFGYMPPKKRNQSS